MKNKITLLLLLTSICSYGQDSTNDHFLGLKIAPLSFLDIYSGMSPRLGVEYKVKNNISFYNEIGTYIPNVNSITHNKGGLTKFEIKYYLDYLNSKGNQYISAELFYKHQSFQIYDTINISSTKYLKDYSVTKDVTCFTIKYGMLREYKYRVFLDYFIGIGLRYKIAKSSLTNEENNNIQPEGSYQANIWLSKAGTFTYFNFDMGIKIGYRIR